MISHKKWFRISIVSSIVMFLSGFIYSLIGMVNLFGIEPGVTEFRNFVNNELNTKFITIMSLLNMVSISIITTFLMSLSKQSSKLDKLDEAEQDYNTARERLVSKINQL